MNVIENNMKILTSYYGSPREKPEYLVLLQIPSHTPPRLVCNFTVTCCWSPADLYVSLCSVSQQMDVRIVRENTATAENQPQKAHRSILFASLTVIQIPPPLSLPTSPYPHPCSNPCCYCVTVTWRKLPDSSVPVSS